MKVTTITSILVLAAATAYARPFFESLGNLANGLVSTVGSVTNGVVCPPINALVPTFGASICKQSSNGDNSNGGSGSQRPLSVRVTEDPLKDNPTAVNIAEFDTTYELNDQSIAAFSKLAIDLGDALAGAGELSDTSDGGRPRNEALGRLITTTRVRSIIAQNPADKEAYQKLSEWFTKARQRYPVQETSQ